MRARGWVVAAVLCLLVAGVAYAAGPVVFWVYEEEPGNVYRAEDLNGDGDALDAGEVTTYGTFDNYVEGFAVDRMNGDVYFAEESPELIYRLRDLDGDGDALDAGEKVLWADDSSRPCDSVESIAIDESSGTVYSTFEDDDCIVWHRDVNGDGDALDGGESGLLTNVGSDLESITVDSNTGRIYAGDNASPDVVQVVSSAGADLGPIAGLGHESNDFDEGRSVLYSGEEDFTDILRWSSGSGITTFATIPNAESSESLGVDPGTGVLFVGTSGNIYRFVDGNGDGDASDGGEINLFVDDSISTDEVEAMGVFPNSQTPVPTVTPTGFAVTLLLLGFVGYAILRR